MPIRTMPHCSTKKERDREVRLRPHDGDSETERQVRPGRKLTTGQGRERERETAFLVGGNALCIRSFGEGLVLYFDM